MTRHRCDVPGCDGTRLGHDLAVDFPEETKRIDEVFDRLRTPREDRVMPENLEVALAPRRIQRRRTKGWRMPEGAIYVGRPTCWGNSWEVGSTGWLVHPGGEGLRDKRPHPPLTRAEAVEQFRNVWDFYVKYDPEHTAKMRAELAGHDLACWCPLDQPCHADVLLELANR